MTRVEGENTRLRHYLARLHRKTLCYSKERGYAEVFNSIITSLFEVRKNTRVNLIHPAFMQRRISYCPLMCHDRFYFYIKLRLIHTKIAYNTCSACFQAKT